MNEYHLEFEHPQKWEVVYCQHEEGGCDIAFALDIFIKADAEVFAFKGMKRINHLQLVEKREDGEN
jgi:hypothetical protein